jgi:hypothetical protein
MELPIVPFDSIGFVEFGASPDTVKASTNYLSESFMKTPMSEMPTDAFDEIGIHIYYSSGKCDAVECFAPARPIFQGRQILGQPYEEIKKWLESIDPHIVFDGSEIQARSFGISVSPGFSEIVGVNSVVEIVLVVDRGYFDRQDAALAAIIASD